MYRYNDRERTMLRQRARQFAGQVRRFRDGALDPELFQQLRLRNGLYKERYAHMLRVAIPYGVLDSAQLIALSEIARDFDRGFGHFTTRQNIQFNWPELDDVPEILRRLAEVGMHAIQTSGSCIRNITCDHLAGVAPDEIVDPRPWCELIRQWATLHPEFNWLPRKFKIALTGARADRAAIQLHDIGLRVSCDAAGRARMRVYAGGGMGRTPVIAKVVAEDIAGADLLGYLHAILRVYNECGRRDHKYRSRIKILVNDLGIEEFRRRVDAEWRNLRASGAAPLIRDDDLARAQSFFRQPNDDGDDDVRDDADDDHDNDPNFARWRAQNTAAHRDPNRRIVHISLKAPGAAPGDLDAAQMEALARLARDYSADEIRVSHEQNLVLAQVRLRRLPALHRALDRIGLATPNIGTLSDMICCPGLDFCSLANAGTLPIARQINARIGELDRLYDIGEIKLKMSGCMNACGHHHAGCIGILGVDKKGEEWYQITLGGSAGDDTRLGARLGPALPRDRVAATIETLIETYLELRDDGERFSDCVQRLGIDPFQQRIYPPKSSSKSQSVKRNANHQEPNDHRQPVAA